MTIQAIKQLLLAENHLSEFPKGKRIQNLDALKLFSMVLVVCLHCTATYYFENGLELWSFTRFLYCAGVLAIPTFFVVSGYQLLGRGNVGYGYALRKVVKLLWSSFLMYIIILLLEKPLLGIDIDWRGIPTQFRLNLLQWGDYGILWFVGALSVVYLLYPLINRVYINHKQLFLCFCGILLVVMTAVFFFSVIYPIKDELREMRISQTYRIWNWVGYFALGGLLKRYSIFKQLGRLWIVAVLAICSFLFLNSILLRRGIWFCEYAYASLPIILYVAAVFMYFMSIKINNRFMAEMVSIFLPAYMFGLMYQYCIEDYFCQLPEYFGVTAMIVVDTILALSSAWLLMKIPGMKRLLRL